MIPSWNKSEATDQHSRSSLALDSTVMLVGFASNLQLWQGPGPLAIWEGGDSTETCAAKAQRGVSLPFQVRLKTMNDDDKLNACKRLIKGLTLFHAWDRGGELPQILLNPGSMKSHTDNTHAGIQQHRSQVSF